MKTIDTLFKAHKLNKQGQDLATVLAAEFEKLAAFIDSIGNDCREKSIALTKLEEACFYSKKTLAMRPENQIKVDDECLPNNAPKK